MRYRYKVKGEKWGFQRRDVLAQFPFPEPPGQIHVPPGIVWNAIARTGYLTRYVNDPLRTYYTDGNDTMTKDDPPRRAYGLRLYHQACVQQDLRWLRQAPAELMRSASQYSRYSFHLGIGGVTQFRDLNGRGARLLGAVALPLGYGMYRRDRRR